MSDLPRGWTETTIGEVIEPYLTIDPRREPDSQFRYIDIGSIDNEKQTITEPKTFAGRDAPSRARRVVHYGDILFSTVRTYLGNIAVVPHSLDGVLTSTGISVLRPSSAIESAYLFNWVRSETFVESMSEAQDGTLYPAVRDSDVSAGRIPLPPLAEQRRIVAKLESLIEGIARVRAELDRLPIFIGHYKQAVLSAGLSGELTREWRCRQSDSDWQDTRAGELFSWTSGKFLPNKAHEDGLIPVYGGNGINGHHNKSLFDQPTIVIGRVGAHCGNVHTTSGPSWITDNAIYANKISNKIVLGFAFHVFRDANLNERSGGTGQPYVNQDILNDVEIFLPPLNEQREIVRQIETAFTSLDRVAVEHGKAAHLLLRLDQAILARAFRGELVAQDPNDEPASALLERVRAARTEAPKRERTVRTWGTSETKFPATGSLTMVQKEQAMNKTRKDVSASHLSDIVKKSGGKIKTDVLWQASEMQIDEFYKLLRDDVTAKRLKESKDKASITDAN